MTEQTEADIQEQAWIQQCMDLTKERNALAAQNKALREALDNAAEEFDAIAHVIKCRMEKRGYDDATLREIALAAGREGDKARDAIAKAKGET